MKRVVCLVLLLCLVSAVSFAGEKNRFGLTLRVNEGATIGLILNLSDRVALRPVVGFSNEKAELNIYDSNGNVVEVQSGEYTALDAGLGILIYIFKTKTISGYAGAEYIYRSGKRDDDYETKNHFTSVLFGLQYRLLKKLWIYGEVGLRYLHSVDDAMGECIPLESGGYYCTAGYHDKSNKWQTYNSGIGIIFFF